MKISAKPTKEIAVTEPEVKAAKPSPKLTAALAAIHKKYGAEALTTVVGGRPVAVKGIKTQWQALDDLLTGDVDEKNRTIPGSGVGLPRGRIIEISGLESSGKSTTILHLIQAVQKAGGTAVYIDAEHSFDPKYAAALGVDLSKLQMCQPDSAEQGLDVAVDLAKSGAVDFIAIDSVSALVPEAENDADMAKQHMGLQARLMGKALRKITPHLANSGCVLIFVNQIRQKIGMVFGNPECLHQDTPIPFVDGTSHTIREVVEKELPGPIWAYDASGTFYPAEIESHYYNGRAKDGELITVTAQGVNCRNGIFSATVSRTHKFLTDSGWKQAEELKKSDKLVTRYETCLNGQVAEFVRGMCCGDTTVRLRGKISASLRLQDSTNPEYVAWKRELLSCFAWRRQELFTPGQVEHWQTGETYAIRTFCEPQRGRDPLPMLAKFSWLSMAVWMMDDAHYDHGHGRYLLSIGRYANNLGKQRLISTALIGIGLGGHRWIKEKGTIVFTVQTSQRIAEHIAPFVPTMMRYKLPEDVVAPCILGTLAHNCTEQAATFIPITSVGPASARKYKQRGYYDLAVPDGHNYLAGNVANGFVVHNTTSGGNALKFYASIRIDIRKVKTLKKGDKNIGIRSRIKVVKNKCAAPFREIFCDLLPGRGITAVYGDPDFGPAEDAE